MSAEAPGTQVLDRLRKIIDRLRGGGDGGLPGGLPGLGNIKILQDRPKIFQDGKIKILEGGMLKGLRGKSPMKGAGLIGNLQTGKIMASVQSKIASSQIRVKEVRDRIAPLAKDQGSVIKIGGGKKGLDLPTEEGTITDTDTPLAIGD